MAKTKSEIQETWNKYWESKGHPRDGHSFVGGVCLCGLTIGQSQKYTTSQAGSFPDSTDAVNAKNRDAAVAQERHDRVHLGVGGRISDAVKGSPQVEFEGGGKRSCRKSPLSLCPIELVEAVADTRAEGDRKYDVGNWQKFEKEGWVDCLSHAIQHLLDFDKDKVWENGIEVDNESPETHLGHAATNIAFILWAIRRGKVTRADFQNIAKVLPAK